MAIFRGTLDEFHRFLGPRIRNAIQAKTKKRKRELRACQDCGEERELEAAHVRGNERKDVILRVLGVSTSTAVVDIQDIASTEAAILRAHEPIEAAFRFLCRGCHVKYDRDSAAT